MVSDPSRGVHLGDLPMREVPVGRYDVKVRADDGHAEAIGSVELRVND